MFEKKNNLSIVFSIIVVSLVLIPSIGIEAKLQQDSFNSSLETEKKIINSNGWNPLTIDGFGKETNLATRGMAIYNDELYIGTQNTKFPKLFQNTFPELLNVLHQFLPNKIPEFLHRTNVFKMLLRVVHFLRSHTIRMGLHLVVKNSEGCEVWKYNYSTNSLVQIVGNNSVTGMKSGFNCSLNCLASVIIEFKGKLYVGTWNSPIGSLHDPTRKGCEIWRFDGNGWEQVVGHNAHFVNGGFGDFDNVGICSMKVFDGYLYASTMNWDPVPFGGFQVWRTSDGVYWEQVVSNGFKQNMSRLDLLNGVTNTYGWCMEVFQNQLYVGTFNSCYRFATSVGMGCQLWRTSTGRNWSKVNLPTGIEGVYLDGFGEAENYGIRTMIVYNNELYIGTATNLLLDKGFEIWKYDGINWHPVISSDVPGVKPGDVEYNGFGNPLNNYAWSMNVTSDGKLWVGTANGRIHNLMEPETVGGELWCYNGTEWITIVKDGIGEKPSGFGNVKNEGLRSIIEYPRGSKNIVVGTFKLISTRPIMPQEGCEVWMRST